jgi:HEAT repeat protein
MNIGRLAHLLFHLQLGEGALVVLLTSFYFMMGIAFVCTRTAAYALFVTGFGSELLPYTYFAIALGTPLLTLIYLGFARALKPVRFLFVILFLMGMITMLFRLGLEYPDAQRVTVFIMPLWDVTLQYLGAIFFWGLVERFLDIRQTKRLGGLLNAGKWSAFSLGGFAVPLIVPLIGTSNLLVVAAASFAVALALLINIVRQRQDVFAAQSGKARPGDLQRPRSLARNGYVLAMLGLVIFSVGSEFLVNSVFYESAALIYADTNQLAAFAATVSAIAGLGTVVSSTFLVGRLLSCFGIAVGLLIQPVVVTIIFIIIAISGSFDGTLSTLAVLSTVAQLSSIMLGHAFFSATQRVITQPVPQSQRRTVSLLSEGVIKPVAIGLAGLLFLFLIQTLNLRPLELALPFTIIGIVWVLLSLWVIRLYPRALKQVLDKRQLTTLSLELGDHSTAQVVKKSLDSAYGEEVLYALGLLEQMQDQDEALVQSLPKLLRHSSSDVQLWVLDYIQRTERREFLHQVTDVLNTVQDLKVQEAALRTLAALGEEDTDDLVNEMLNHPQMNLQRGAMIGLLHSGGLDGILRSGHKLQQLLVSPEPQQRALAAEILGESGLRNFYQPLMPLLHDDHPLVRRQALIAAGKIRHPRLWETVVQEVEDETSRSAAIIALTNGADSVLPTIKASFQSQSSPSHLLIRLARVCGRVRSRAAMQLLESHMDFPDPDVRTAIYSSLNLGGYQAQKTERVEKQIQVEAEQGALVLAALNDLEVEESVELLHDALRQQLLRVRERLLFLISFIYDPHIMLGVRQAVVFGSPQQRAYGIELLDTTLSKTTKPYVLPFVQPLQPAEQLDLLLKHFDLNRLAHDQRILDLVGTPQRWVRACAIYAAGRRRLKDAIKPLQAAAKTDDPLLEESARIALFELTTKSASDGAQRGINIMTSTLEKVIILKTVSIFANTPDDVLVEVASLLEEERISSGTKLFSKGDLGTCMYIVVTGKVRIHDAETTLDYRGARQVFGELALLDPEPRIASVTAVEDSLLFRLDQEPFYELMADQIEVVRGIMQVVTQSLRARVMDVTELRSRVNALENAAPHASPHGSVSRNAV